MHPRQILKSRKGFTLVEIILTLIAAGILGAVFIQFMGTALERSADALDRVNDEAEAEADMERIVADYVYELNRDPDNAFTALETRRAGGQYGSGVTFQPVVFDVTGGNGALQNYTGSDPQNLQVTITRSGNSLTTLLTKSRVAGQDNPPVMF